MSEPAKPQAQVILEQLAAWLGEIQQVNGYYSDAGLDVRTEQDRDDEPLAPCLLLLDEEAVIEFPVKGIYGTCTQQYTIEALIHDDGQGRLIARQVLADIHRALRRRATAWPAGSGVSHVRELSRSLERRPGNSDWLTPTVTIEVDYLDRESAP